MEEICQRCVWGIHVFFTCKLVDIEEGTIGIALNLKPLYWLFMPHIERNILKSMINRVARLIVFRMRDVCEE